MMWINSFYKSRENKSLINCIKDEYCFIGKTDEEISLVCRTTRTPQKAREREDGWKAFKIQGILDFSLVGILSKISTLMAENNIGIFAISTYNTDYILIKRENFGKALDILKNRGYRNVCGNPFTIFFSTVFPLLMSYLISKTYLRQIPEAYRITATTGIFITMSLVIPMSVFLIGYGANYSQELEKDIPLRMNLFGFTQAGMIVAKVIANLLFLTAALLVYVTASCVLLEIQIPQLSAAAALVMSLYGLAVVFYLRARSMLQIFQGSINFNSILLSQYPME